MYKENYHIPIMVDEVIQQLNLQENGLYIDCTFGGGGHSQAILNHTKCKVIGIDQDPDVSFFAKNIKEKYKDNFIFINDNFINIENIIKKYGKADGILIDLGVSSMQLKIKDRGFSFMQNGPLDMRMGKDGKTAQDIINTLSEKELADIIYNYGDEKQARKIAKNIMLNRPIETTEKLAQVIRQTIGNRSGKIDSATRTFQAIRIFINDEINNLKKFLSQLEFCLKDNGRIAIITFHSIEDKIVKDYFKKNKIRKKFNSKYKPQIIEGIYKILNNKPTIPSLNEIKTNHSARSSKLRAAIYTGGNKTWQKKLYT